MPYQFQVFTDSGSPFAVSFDTEWEEGTTPTYTSADAFEFQIFYEWLGTAFNGRGQIVCPDRYCPRDLYEALTLSWPHGFEMAGEIPDNESLPLAEQWDEFDVDAILESAQVRTPITTEENIQRGTEAMRHVISSKRIETHAMYRKGLGWISFSWGTPGTPPPNFKNQQEAKEWWDSLPGKESDKGKKLFSSGKGVAHIIAKRDWEAKWMRQFVRQVGRDVAFQCVEVIAKGTIEPERHKKAIIWGKLRVSLVPDSRWDDSKALREKGKKREEYWLLSGLEMVEHYEIIAESAGGVSGGTHPSHPTHLMPTVTCHEVGAADSQAVNIPYPNANSNTPETQMGAIFERASFGIAEEIRNTSTFQQIEELFARFFGDPAPIKPGAYKDESSDYGLKVRGKKARERLNTQCRDILTRVKTSSELTQEDRDVLLQYSGRGGLTENSQYEYYTPKPVAEAVWEALAANGFENGNVLDPCCGAGIFSGTKPAGVIITANDLDPIGSGVAALLNPEDTVSTQPFERVVTNTPDDTFDSCVGNVPFGNARGGSMHEDPAYKSEKLIERYFLHRILDKVKPGGLACLVVPANIVGAKGKKWEEFRIAISRKAEFLGAHKLPSKTFSAQGTDTVVDIIVLRKHSHDLTSKIDELTIDNLREARVVWDEFVTGKYWQGEGRQFVMGRYVPKVAGDRWSRDTVDGDIDDVSFKRKLAQKFHSRIDWEALTLAEPVIRAYSEGDRKSISGTMYEFVAGQWKKIIETASDLKIDEGKFGAKTLDELRSLLSSPKGSLSLHLNNVFAVYKEFPHLLDSLQREAVEFAMSQAGDLFHEQIYRGCIIGGMMARMASKAESGEDVNVDRAELQEMVSTEVEKYGHPKNNKGLVLAGAGSRLFGMFKGAVDEKGNFSDLLAGTLDKSKRETPYDVASPADIVSHLFIREGQQDIFLEDVQELYKGAARIASLGDIAEREDLAITPDGRIMPLNRYCAGDIYPKMAECAQAIAGTDDIRLQSKYRAQIEAMRSRQTVTKSEDIVFGMRQKWLSRKYIVEFLRENGFSQVEFGSTREVDVVQYDGSTEKEKKFAADYENPNGEFSGIPEVAGFYKQFESYINGGKVTSSKKELKQEYQEKVSLLERQFNTWMQQHPDILDLTEQFNRQFNGHVPFQYEGDPLGIEDYISGEIVPHNYQNAEVRRLSEQGSGICGFGVGLGKSFTALATAAYNHKKGRSKRTCMVVPSAVLENWYHEARQFYAEGYMRSNVLFVGLEPKTDKDGVMQRAPVLDEKGKPKIGRTGEAVMQDIVVFRNSKENIHEAMWKIPQSNISLVIMTKEKFASIPLNASTKKKYTDEMVSKSLMSEKLADKIAVGKKSYQDDKNIANIEAKFSNEGSRKANELPYLEDMGFDSIITDESHFFKNSFEGGKESQGIAYLPTAPAAQIAIDMAIKSHYVRGQNTGRGVYGLTATPVTNSPFEIFNMLSLVAPTEEFERFGVHTVDDFVRVFGKIETVDKVTVSGELKSMDGLVGFQNLDGLRNLFHKYVTVKTVKDVDGEIHVPDAEEIEENVSISEEQAIIYESLRKRAKKAAGPKVEGEEKESIFSIIRDMDRLTTDIDMYRRTMTFTFQRKHREAVDALLATLPQQVTVEEHDDETDEKITVKRPVTKDIDDDGGETFTVVVPDFADELVLMRFAEHGIVEAEVAHPVTPKYAKLIENLTKHFETGGKQIVFTEEKTQHKKLRRIIVHHLPMMTEKLGIINAEDASGDKLDKISKAFNSGQLKIIIANKKAEVGVNLQKGTTAIHHLTLPWTPASINQRNGRGVRQGNSVDSVSLYYYCGKGTFDSYRKDLLKAKSNWINDLLLGDATAIDNGDVTGMDELLDMLADNPEEAKRMRAERLASEKAKKEEAFRAALTNKLQVLASTQGNLDTLETQKKEKLTSLQGQLDTTNRAVLRFQSYMDNPSHSESEKKEFSIKLQSAQQRSEKIASEIDGLDDAFDKRRVQLEANKKMALGTLRQADKEGRLPFNSAILDHPNKALVTTAGDILCVGDMLELHKTGEIYRIKSLSQSSRSYKMECLSRIQAEKTVAANNVPPYTKVSFSDSELALKKVLGDLQDYAKLRDLGVDKESFLAHAHEIRLTHKGVVYHHEGKLVVSFSDSRIPEGAVLAWPEPENEDWRKAVCLQYIEATRKNVYVPNTLMIELFGNDFQSIANAYGRIGTIAEIMTIAASTWEQHKAKYQQPTFSRSILVDAVLEQFDNRHDIDSVVGDFLSGIVEADRKRKEEERHAAERRATEFLKSDPNYKEVPQDMREKFSAISIDVRPNTNEDKLNRKTYAPFSRWFLHDNAGYNGRLREVKEILRSRWKAQYTTEWLEGAYGTSWWHVPSSVSLDELYELLS